MPPPSTAEHLANYLRSSQRGSTVGLAASLVGFGGTWTALVTWAVVTQAEHVGPARAIIALGVAVVTSTTAVGCMLTRWLIGLTDRVWLVGILAGSAASTAEITRHLTESAGRAGNGRVHLLADTERR
jgi:hypothetical protein